MNILIGFIAGAILSPICIHYLLKYACFLEEQEELKIRKEKFNFYTINRYI